MISFRSLAFALLALAGPVLAAAPAFADPPPWAHSHHDQGERGNHSEESDRAQDRGVISGEIVGVDYMQGVIILQNGPRRIPIVVLPSTNIYAGRRGFATVADLVRGRRVDVWTSESGGRLFAQMIRIH
jgi:hypothetical protein